MSKRQLSHEDNASNRPQKIALKSGDQAEMEQMWAKLQAVQNQVWLLTERVSRFEPIMGNVMGVVASVKETLENSINEEKFAKIMKAVICQVRIEEGEKDILQTKKKETVGASEASVSPVVISKKTKGKNVDLTRQKTRVLPLPKYQRALFRDDKDAGTLIKNLDKMSGMKRITRAGPFTSKSPLSKEDARIVEYIFYKRARKESDSNQQICYCKGSLMTRNKMCCLRPGGLVCSALIDTYAEYLNNGGSDWYMNTYLCVITCGGMNKHKTYEYWIAHSTSLCRVKRFHGKIGICDRIFIPMFDQETNARIGHWYLMVIHVKDRYVELIDSFEEEARLVSRRRDAKSVMDMLDVILGCDNISLSSLPWAYTKSIRQPNSEDCGIFVIRNMEDPTSKWADQYDSQTQRLRLLLDCVRHFRNEVTGLQAQVDESLIIWKGEKGKTKGSKDVAPTVVNLVSEETNNVF